MSILEEKRVHVIKNYAKGKFQMLSDFLPEYSDTSLSFLTLALASSASLSAAPVPLQLLGAHGRTCDIACPSIRLQNCPGQT